MAYTQQLINKEDHLLACTTRMFETQPLLAEISNAPIPRNKSRKINDLDVKAAEFYFNTLTHILAVSDYSLVKERESINSKTLGDKHFRAFRLVFPTTVSGAGRTDSTDIFVVVNLF